MNGQMKRRKCCVCLCHHLVFDTPEEEKAYWEAKRKKDHESDMQALKWMGAFFGALILGLLIATKMGYIN